MAALSAVCAAAALLFVPAGLARAQGPDDERRTVRLTGPAALFYLFHRHADAPGAGPQGRYYLSRNGRVYYRDRTRAAHFVQPPAQGLRVRAEEAEICKELIGFDGRATGKELADLIVPP